MAKLPLSIAALGAALLAAPIAAAHAAAPPPTTTVPAAAAAGWLAQQFGDHLDFPGTSYFDAGATADAVFALAASKTGRTKIDQAMRYFAANVDAYTNLQDTDGKPGPYDGSVAKTAVAAFAAGLDPRSFGGHDLIAALHTDQCTAKSAPKSPTDYTTPTCPAAGAARNIFSSVSESFAILAEGRAATEYGAPLGPDQAARRYFDSLQCPDGGFTVATTGKNCTSDVDATAYAVMALAALPSRPTTRVSAAVHWLRANEQAGGYWIGEGVPNVDSTGLAAAALDSVGEDTPTARGWLAQQQVTAGPTIGSGASRGALAFEGHYDPSSAVKATSDGTLGLVKNGALATLTDTGATPGTAVLALAGPTVTARQVRQGGDDKATGTGFSRHETVIATLDGAKVGTATADANGTASVTLRVSSAVAAGSYPLTLTGASSALSTSTDLRVLPAAATAPRPHSPAPPTASPPPSAASRLVAPAAATSAAATPVLAATGTPGLAALLAVGIGSVLVGAAALLLGRRRRT